MENRAHAHPSAMHTMSHSNLRREPETYILYTMAIFNCYVSLPGNMDTVLWTLRKQSSSVAMLGGVGLSKFR